MKKIPLIVAGPALVGLSAADTLLEHGQQVAESAIRFIVRNMGGV